MTGPSGSTGPGAWPGLGFDPAPGEVTAVDWLTSGLIGASRTLLGARDTLDVVRTAPGGWEGDAARAFIAKVGQLPEQLGAAHASLDKAASALHRWQATLEQLQGRARDLEARAVAARRQLHEASAAAEAARRAPDLALAGRHFDIDAELTDAQARLNSALTAVDDADRRLESARAGLEQLISEGRRLLAEHGTAADSAATAVLGSIEGLAPSEPGWLDEADDWFVENAERVGDVAGVVSAVAGTLALLPPLTAVAAPVALVSGAVALGAHGVGINEKGSWGEPGSWVTLAGDGLGMVPAVGALGKAAGAGMEAARVGGGLAAGTGRVKLASTSMARGARAFGRVFRAEALQPDASPVFERLGEATAQRWSGNARIIGKLEQGVASVGPQMPTVDSWAHPSGEGEYLKDPAGTVGTLVSGAQSPLYERSAGLSADLRSFVRAVR